MPRASKELLKGASARIVLLFTSILIGFFMMPYLLHSLGEEFYGLWVIAGSIIAFYSLLDVGMFGAMQRFMMQSIYKNDKNDINLTLSTNVFITSVLGVLALIVTTIVIIMADRFIDDESMLGVFRIIIALLGVKAALQFPLYSFYGILMAKYKYHVISQIQFINLLARTLFIITLVETGFGLAGIAFATFTMELLSSMVVARIAYHNIPHLQISFKNLSKKRFKEYLHFGKYAYVIAISDKVRLSMDNLLIGGLINLVAVTQYTIGATLIHYFESIMGSIFGVLGSVLNKYHTTNQMDKLREVFLVVSEISALLAFFIGSGLYLFGAEFISIWIGDQYFKSYVVLQILLVSTVVAVAQTANIQVLMAMARHKQQAYAMGIEAILNLILSVILGIKYGIYGIAVGTTIPLVINSLIVRPMYTCKQVRVKYKVYYKIQLKIALLSLFTFTVAYWVKGYTEIISYFDIALGASLFTIMYFLLYVRFFMGQGVSQYVYENIDKRFYRIFKLISRF